VEKIGIDNEFNSLSGGQKQRIAIARALIKKPEILILDEGTSALDRRTEQEVLRALKKMRIPFILMIAHRMETVVNADRIVMLQKGKIVAEGNFTDLVRKGVLEDIKINRQEDSSEEKKSQ
jgi:ABC-type multidrug transport system fused ATPase/permease subunit